MTAASDANGLPVVVWLHGGAYVSGGGEAPKYAADELARLGRVVVAHAWADAPMLGGGPIDDRLAETMRRNWSGFAHHGVDGLDSPSLCFG